jgi:hypothetical protein
VITILRPPNAQRPDFPRLSHHHVVCILLSHEARGCDLVFEIRHIQSPRLRSPVIQYGSGDDVDFSSSPGWGSYAYRPEGLIRPLILDEI